MVDVVGIIVVVVVVIVVVDVVVDLAHIGLTTKIPYVYLIAYGS